MQGDASRHGHPMAGDLDPDSTRIQVDALGHTLTPF